MSKFESLTYDAQGNITGVEDGNGNQTEFGGAGEFERMTGFKYGSSDAVKVSRNKNIEYLLGLIKN